MWGQRLQEAEDAVQTLTTNLAAECEAHRVTKALLEKIDADRKIWEQAWNRLNEKVSRSSTDLQKCQAELKEAFTQRAEDIIGLATGKFERIRLQARLDSLSEFLGRVGIVVSAGVKKK